MRRSAAAAKKRSWWWRFCHDPNGSMPDWMSFDLVIGVAHLIAVIVILAYFGWRLLTR